MGLKQSIMVKNEFSLKIGDKKGTRGGTPGNFVLSYVARSKGATEILTPIRRDNLDIFDFTTRYVARDEATERFTNKIKLKKDMKAIDGYGGVAFGNGDISLSDEDLRERSKRIQNAFDNDKTVFKTVLSFTEEYLRENEIILPTFKHKVRGDYRGNIDQLKLRHAIMKGMDRMCRNANMDNPQYVGAIQVDTNHVHCHLVLVDEGVGRLRKDGTQNGKITEPMKRDLRRGIDLTLDREKTIPFMASHVQVDRLNVKSFVKRAMYKVCEERSFAQFMMACLPEDRTMWRAGTNRREMKKANELCHEFVVGLFERPDSGYMDAYSAIEAYAKTRKERENLTEDETKLLIRNGQNKLVEECMNGVYDTLKQLPKDKLKIKTPVMDVMSMDLDSLISERDNNGFAEFALRFRTYRSRLHYHTKMFEENKRAVKVLEKADVTEQSYVIPEFYKLERDYQEALMVKYQHLLPIMRYEEDTRQEFEDIMDYAKKRDNLFLMMADKRFKKMKPETAKEYGQNTYGQNGGQFVKSNPKILQERYDMMNENFQNRLNRFLDKVDTKGYHVTDDMELKDAPKYDFDSVKALDLHHLQYDFSQDVNVSFRNVENFCKVADMRYSAYQKVKEYLIGTNQASFLEQFPGKDIEIMHEYADFIRVNPILKSSVVKENVYPRTKTFSLDDDYGKAMELSIKQVLNDIDVTGL